MIAQRRKAGFTLVELMITVAVFAVLAGMMVTPVRRTVLEQRLMGATRDFVSLVRGARAGAMGTRRAHLVYVNTANLTVRVLRGRHNSCVAQAWATLDAECTSNVSGRRSGTECSELSFDDDYYSLSATTTLTLAEVPAAATRAICFAPNGTVYLGTSLASNALSSANTVSGGILFEFGTTGGITLPARRVLIPLGGDPRMIQ